MQDENAINEPNSVDEENTSEWQPPPPPEKIVEEEPPQMSEVATLGNIFLEPGRTFEDLRRKPRFLLAGLITAILITAFSFAFYYKVGDAGYRTFFAEQIDKSSQAQGLNAEQRKGAIDLNMTITAVVRYAMPLLVFIGIAIGGLFYWLGGKAFGGSGGFMHGVSVWVYSSFPPAVVGMVANFIILAFKSVDDIDIAASQRGVVHANPSFLMDGKAMPVLATLVGTLDLFLIWGWILASIGLQKTHKISSGTAWAVTILLALIGIAFRVFGAVMSGNPS